MGSFFIFIIVLLGGTAIICKNGSSLETKKKALTFAWIVITVFAGSNDALNFGGDISAYFHHVLRSGDLSLEDYMHQNPFEPGFCIYLWSVVHLFHNPQIFLFVQYGLVSGIVLYFIYKYADNAFYGVIGYVCLGGFMFYFTAMRQAVAMSLCLIGLMQLLRGRMLWSLVWIALATTFHMTAIVVIPAFLVTKLELTQRNIALVIIGCVILTIFMRPLVNMGNDYMGEEYGKNVYIFKSYTGAIISIITMVGAIWLFLKNRNLGLNEPDDNMFFYITIIALTLYLMRFEVLAMERVSFYFAPIVGVGLSNCAYRYRCLKQNPSITFWYTALAAILLLVRVGNTFGSSYRMIW